MPRPRITNPRAAEDPVAYMDAVRASEHGQRYKGIALKALDLRPGLSVLDVGCGTGDDAIEFARRVSPGGHVVGIDADPAMVKAANTRADGLGLPIEFAENDLFMTNLADQAFDRSYADRVFQLLNGRQKDALAEIARVTKAGGAIVICCPDTSTFEIEIGEPAITSKIVAFMSEGRWLGGMLANLMADCGLTNITSDAVQHRETDFSAVDRSTPVRLFADWALAGRAIAGEERDRWLDAFDNAVAENTFAFSSAIVVTRGVKPGA